MANRVILHQIKNYRVGFSTGALSSLARKVIKAAKPSLLKKTNLVEINLIWVSDQEIKKLNAKYRKKNCPTDVLSFSYLDERDNNLLGELFISVDTLKKQAKDYQHPFNQEGQILFTHGLLHILGFDHETKADLKKMLKFERVILGDKSGLIERAESE